MSGRFFSLLCSGVLLTLAALLLPGCSVSSRLAEGEYALRGNSIEVQDAQIQQGSLQPYLMQKSPSFSLFGSKVEVYSDALRRKTEESIADHMAYLGYYDSKVLSHVDTSGRKVRVAYLVLAGHRFPIREIGYDVPQGEFAADFYADTLQSTVKAGDFLSEEALEAESERGAAAMRTKGYYGFTKYHYFFEADTLSYPGEAVLLYNIREYARGENPIPRGSAPIRKSRIGDVTISHSADIPFRQEVLTSLNTVQPGKYYDERDISTTYSRMSALRVFNSVGVTMSARDSSTVDCAISLSESNLQSFKVNLEASTNSSGLMALSPQLRYTHKNIFHGGEWLNLSFLGNFQFKPGSEIRSNEFAVSAGVSFPKFLGLPYSLFNGPSVPRTEVNLSYSYQDRPEYTRNIFAMSLGYTGTDGRHWQYQMYPIQINMVQLHNLEDDFYDSLILNPIMKYSYQDHLDAGIGGTLYYASDLSANPSSSWWYSRLSLDLSGNLLSLFRFAMPKGADGSAKLLGVPYSQYVKGEWTLARTWTLGLEEKSSVAARLVAGAGYAYGNSTALPFEKQFYVGGASSMRGWQARALGPGSEPRERLFAIPSQTGDVRLEANLEYRFGMFWKLEGALFTDVGNVWTLNDYLDSTQFSGDFYKKLAADWGVGIRANLNFLIIRVDMGFQLRDPVADGTWFGPEKWFLHGAHALHFGVGYPF